MKCKSLLLVLLFTLTSLVPAKQESNLHPGMAACGVGHRRRSNLQRCRVTTQARWCLNPDPARSAIRGSCRPVPRWYSCRLPSKLEFNVSYRVVAFRRLNPTLGLFQCG